MPHEPAQTTIKQILFYRTFGEHCAVAAQDNGTVTDRRIETGIQPRNSAC